MTSLYSFESIPHVQGVSTLPDNEYKVFYMETEIKPDLFPFQVFAKNDEGRARLSFVVEEHRAPHVTHICLFSETRFKGSLICCGTSAAGSPPGEDTLYGPFKVFEHAGWCCIPVIVSPVAGTIFLVPFSGIFRRAPSITVSRAAVLAVHPPLRPPPLAPPVFAPALQRAADTMFAARPEPGVRRSRLLGALEPDVTLLCSDGAAVRAHSAVLRARCRAWRALDMRVARVPFAGGLVRASLHFVYSGDAARLVGLFDEGTRRLLAGASLTEFFQEFCGSARAATPAATRALLLGALPFFEFARATGATSLGILCADYLLETLTLLAVELADTGSLRAAIAAHGFEEDFFHARMCHALSVIDPAHFPLPLVADLDMFAAGFAQLNPVDRARLAQEILPNSYDSVGRSRTLATFISSNLGRAAHVSSVYRGDFFSNDYWKAALESSEWLLEVSFRPEMVPRYLKGSKVGKLDGFVTATSKRVRFLGRDKSFRVLTLPVRFGRKKTTVHSFEIVPGLSVPELIANTSLHKFLPYEDTRIK